MFKPSQARRYADEELVALYRQSGDASWLGVLLERHTVLLLGVACKYLTDKVLAQDAVQHVFTRALTSFPKEEVHNIKGWLYVLLRNHCLQILRDRHFHSDESVIDGLPGDDAEARREELRLREVSLESLAEALPRLNEAQRVCITLFYLEKKSYEQVGAATGFTFREVKTHIQNGKRNLRKAIEQSIAQNDPN